MWYSTGTGWIQSERSVESVYVVVHATSEDGITWIRDGIPCLPVSWLDECQTSPSVIEIVGRYHMWFCYRYGVDFRNSTRGYRIGYAWSDDLKTWQRDDALGELTPSVEGWDSQMVCYPSVVQLGGQLHLFYSGNNFGESGFGFAVAQACRRIARS